MRNDGSEATVPVVEGKNVQGATSAHCMFEIGIR